MSVGEGQMMNLPRSVANVWTSNPTVADVFVNSPRQINLFGKGAGEATIIATAADGSVVYGANVRVNQNISSINEILRQAMPDSDINVTTIGQVAVINGTVASPDDAAQAELLFARRSTGNRCDECASISSDQPAAHGDAASGDAQGAYRGDEPYRPEAGRRQSLEPRFRLDPVRHRTGQPGHDQTVARCPASIRLPGFRPAART